MPNLLGDRPEPIEPRDQRGVQGGGDREVRQRARRQYRRDPVVAIAAFEHRLGQLLDKQRHAVGALDDLVDGLAGEAGIAGEPLDQRRAVVPAEPVQRQRRHMRLTAPGVLELGAEGDDEQDRQPRDPIERQVEQFARGRVDPMRVLEHHQDRPAPRQGFELMQQRFEQHLALALRAEVELGGGIRQRQQLGQQLDFVITPRTGREQFSQLAELLLRPCRRAQTRRRVRAGR